VECGEDTVVGVICIICMSVRRSLKLLADRVECSEELRSATAPDSIRKLAPL